MSTNDIESDHQSNTQNPDVSNVNRYLLNPKSNCNIGTWNVHTMYSTSTIAQVIKKMGNYKLDILGISECRWTGSGRMCTKSETGESYTIIYSGQQDTHHPSALPNPYLYHPHHRNQSTDTRPTLSLCHRIGKAQT